jgi:hypothetical protein
MNLNDLVMPLESAEFIMKNAKSVQILDNGVENLAQKVGAKIQFLITNMKILFFILLKDFRKLKR